MTQDEKNLLFQKKNQIFLNKIKELSSIDRGSLSFMEALVFYFEKHPEDTMDLTQFQPSLMIPKNGSFDPNYSSILTKLFVSDEKKSIPLVRYKIHHISNALSLLLSQELSPEKISEYLYEAKTLLLSHLSDTGIDYRYDSLNSSLFEKYYNSDFYNKEDALLRYFQDEVNKANYILSNQFVPNVIFRNSNLIKLEDQIKILQCYLNNTENLQDIMNQNNLKVLQERYPDSFEVTTNETRLCKNKPTSSSSPRLKKETIRLEYKHTSGRDVYYIHRTYTASINKTETLFDYRRARRLAENWKFNSNTTKNILMPPIPYVTSGHISYYCTRELISLRLKEKLREKYSQYSFGMIDSFVFAYYSLLREKTYDTVLNILELNKNMNTVDPIHDSLYQYIDLPLTILTPSLQKHLLTLSVDDLKNKWGFLHGIQREASRNEIKSLRKMIYSCFRKKMPPEEIMSIFDMMHEKQIIKEYNLSHEQLEQITKFFLPVIRRYNHGMTPSRFIKIFGKNGIHKILGDEKECVFTPKEYRLPSMETTALAALVNERLGSLKNEDNLSARKRLYHRLDVICPVEDILNDKIPKEDIPRIKKALNLSPNKTLNLAGNFSAKIEEKCSPEFLIAGDASVCCMGLGSSKAVDYALKPGFGIFNVYFKDRIIANSLIWVNNDDTLVIDNIEVHPNYQHHDTYIREMYNQMINDISKIYPNIVQGETYNDLELYDRHTPCGELKTWKPVKIDGNFYSDAEDMCFLIKGNTDVFTPNTRNRMAASDDDFLENFNEEPQQHPAPVF